MYVVQPSLIMCVVTYLLKLNGERDTHMTVYLPTFYYYRYNNHTRYIENVSPSPLIRTKLS